MILRITVNNKFNLGDVVGFSSFLNWGLGTFDVYTATETAVVNRNTNGQVKTGATATAQTTELFNALSADGGPFFFTQSSPTSIDITSFGTAPIFNYSATTTAVTFSTTGATTINLNTFPAVLRAGYNPIVYTFYAQPDVNKQGYRYIADVYNSKSNELIGSYKITPNIDDTGYVDIQKILSNFLTCDLHSSSLTVANASRSHINYRTEIGEEYIYAKNYTGTQKFTGSTTFSGYTQVNFPTSITFSAGNLVELSTLQSQLNGIHTVLSANTNTLVIDKIWPSTTSLSGTARYSDYRKIKVQGLSIVSGTTAFNGALNWVDYKGWTPNNYVVNYTSTGSSKTLLTSLPTSAQIGTNPENRILVGENQDFWMNYYIDNATGTSIYARYKLISKTGTIKQSYTNQIQSGGETSFGNVKQFKVNFNGFSTGLSEGDYMIFNLENGTGATLTADYRLDLDTRCRREDYQILFMDSYGSIQSMQFQNKLDRKQTINRNTYLQTNFIPLPLQTNLEDGGVTNYNMTEDLTYTLTSNWLTTGQSNMYNELIKSARTWIKIGSNYLACIVQETDNQMMVQKDRKIFNKTINVKLSNSNPINI